MTGERQGCDRRQESLSALHSLTHTTVEERGVPSSSGGGSVCTPDCKTGAQNWYLEDNFLCVDAFSGILISSCKFSWSNLKCFRKNQIPYRNHRLWSRFGKWCVYCIHLIWCQRPHFDGSPVQHGILDYGPQWSQQTTTPRKQLPHECNEISMF